MRATIKMIAEQAGVSIGTVDRVLHNRPYVKAEVRERVLRVMEELDYRPNQMASALATSGTARRLAVVQPEWDPYVGEAMDRGVARFREERRDYNLTVDVRSYKPGDTGACLNQMDQVVENGAQGIALCASDCGAVRAKLEDLKARRVPVVTFNSDIPGGARLCYVGEDAHRAGRIAGEIAAKFLRPGEPLLLVYAGLDYAGHKARADGFLERLGELGFRREDCRVAATHNDYGETLAAVTAALEAEPDLGYVYMANLSVPACVEAIRRCGRTGRVRVLSHDSGPEIRQFLKEGLVDFTIDQNLVYQSYQSLDLLFRAVAERKQPEREFFYPASPILNAETL
nr:substrate-binding domain-containing protein [uncultured Oscillibacter sp.]